MLAAVVIIITVSIFSVPASFSGSCCVCGAQKAPALPQTSLVEKEHAFPRGCTRISRVGSDWSNLDNKSTPEPITVAESPGPPLNHSWWL